MSSTLEPGSKMCKNDCLEPGRFPEKIDNRPGLSTIDYRIGDYSSIREFLLKKIDTIPALSGWTYRSSDDPAIALLEGAAILGDILTYYQKLYANEGYLVPAKWRESIYDLVRLTGYMLSPPVGGHGYFNFLVKGEKPVSIPANFPLRARLEGPEKPEADFETLSDITAWPELGDFLLYRPVKHAMISNGTSKFMIYGEVDLKEDDLLFLGKPSDQPGIYEKMQIVHVKKVKPKFGGHEVTITGSWQNNDAGDTLEAFKLKRNFRYFGYNVPEEVPMIQADGMVQMYKIYDVDPDKTKRMQHDTHGSCENWLLENLLPGAHTVFQADGKIEGISPGAEVLLTGKINDLDDNLKRVDPEQLSQSEKFMISRHTVSGIEHFHNKKASVEGNCTKFLLNALGSDELIQVGVAALKDRITVNIRTAQLWEIAGGKMVLKGGFVNDDDFNDATTLYYYGTFASYQALHNRMIALKRGSLSEQLTGSIDFSADESSGKELFYPVHFLPVPENFGLEDFPLEAPDVAACANLVYAAQGKSEKEKILGNGDSSQVFQTFQIPKKALTYHLQSDASPPEVPELQVYVNDIEWSLVSSLYNQKPKDEIYILRRDHKGVNWIQFGDGKTGARLPSGVNNVKIKYKTGTGAYGPLKEESKAQASAPLKSLKEIGLPGIISGGATEESGENARFTAPGKLQSLERLVSIQDYESEAMAIAGVLKVSARCVLYHGAPSIVMTVLMEQGRSAEFRSVKEKIQKVNQSKGSLRHSIQLVEASFKYVYLDITIFIGSKYRQDLVEPELVKSLGASVILEKTGIVENPGLFSLQRRNLGQSEYLNNVAAVMQNIEAVEWVEVNCFGALRETDPEDLLTARNGGEKLDKIFCNNKTLLILHKEHLKINFASGGTGHE